METTVPPVAERRSVITDNRILNGKMRFFLLKFKSVIETLLFRQAAQIKIKTYP